MKRRDLPAHLLKNGCRFVPEGGSHSIYENPLNGKPAAVPRHREIADFTAIKICQQLEIPTP